MTLEILLFASYREAVGQRRLHLELGPGATVKDAARELEAVYPDLSLKGALAAVNEDYVRADAPLADGDTLAFFPPVSGGVEGEPDDEPDDLFLVGESALDLGALSARVSAPAYGAVALFVGTVRSPNAGREVLYIDYEGYPPMIRRQMARVAQEARERHALGRLVLAHRLGRLGPGEASILVAVSSPHRRDALAACRFCIDRCKELLPVWKYEVNAGEGGGRWVEGSSAAADSL